MSHVRFLHKLLPPTYNVNSSTKTHPLHFPLHQSPPRLHLHKHSHHHLSSLFPYIMASNQPSNNSSAYQSSGGFKNFMESYGGRMWNDADVQEAKAIGAAMHQHDTQQAKSSGSTKSSSSSNRK